MVRIAPLAIVLAGLIGPALAGGAAADSFACRDGHWRGWERSFDLDDPTDASINGYNALLWAGATAGVRFGAGAPGRSRWNDPNDFDDEIRDGLRLSSSSGRSAARAASHALLAAAIAGPAIGMGRTWLRDGDCDQALEMASGFAESITLTLLVSEATKIISARKRPSGGGSDSRQSFFSGHASIAAAGAGMTCSHSLKRRIWGDSALQRALPCALGASFALATGLMRISADDHWATDVLAGWALGSLIGYFDLPGPFDLLRFRVRGRDGSTTASGIVLPYAAPGSAGVQLSMRF